MNHWTLIIQLQVLLLQLQKAKDQCHVLSQLRPVNNILEETMFQEHNTKIIDVISKAK